MKVLTVDDSAAIRERLKTMISEIPGAELVGEAEDGLGAIEEMKRLNPDIVLLDIKMGGMNGIGTVERIRDYGLTATVIMFTNYDYPQYRKKCMALGADYFFKKSTEFEKLREVIEKLVRESKDQELKIED
ncbi:MAG: response regulator [Pseudomonadota bacterium]